MFVTLCIVDTTTAMFVMLCIVDRTAAKSFVKKNCMRHVTNADESKRRSLRSGSDQKNSRFKRAAVHIKFARCSTAQSKILLNMNIEYIRNRVENYCSSRQKLSD